MLVSALHTGLFKRRAKTTRWLEETTLCSKSIPSAAASKSISQKLKFKKFVRINLQGRKSQYKRRNFVLFEEL